MFARPAGRSTPCESRMFGSAAECDLKIPIRPDGRRTTRGFFNDVRNDRAAFADMVRIKGATSTERDLIEHAWAAMALNTDIMRYAICWVEGFSLKDDAGDHIDAHIRNLIWPPMRVTARVNEMSGALALPDLTGGVIRIGRNGLSTNLSSWGASDIRQRLCGVLDLASTLFHEMTHIELLSNLDFLKKPENACYDSYLLENIFRWGLYKRYQLRTCCAKADTLWGDNEINYCTKTLAAL